VVVKKAEEKVPECDEQELIVPHSLSPEYGPIPCYICRRI
jgi:hypothetical protein